MLLRGINDVAQLWLASGTDDSTACNSNQGKEKRKKKTCVNAKQTPPSKRDGGSFNFEIVLHLINR